MTNGKKKNYKGSGLKGARYPLSDEAMGMTIEMFADVFYKRHWEAPQVTVAIIQGLPEALLGFALDRGDLVTVIHYLMDHNAMLEKAATMAYGYLMSEADTMRDNLGPDMAQGIYRLAQWIEAAIIKDHEAFDDTLPPGLRPKAANGPRPEVHMGDVDND